MQIIFLGWMTMAEILDNPFGYNMEYDVNLAEVSRFDTGGPGEAKGFSHYYGIGAVNKERIVSQKRGKAPLKKSEACYKEAWPF